MVKFYLIPTLIIGLIFSSCAGSRFDSEITIRDMFDKGMENLEKEKYLQAQDDFHQVLIRGIGTEMGDDAQYFLAEAYYRNEEYIQAVVEYEKLTRTMGFSTFVEDARFKICEAYRIESPKYYHDQDYTDKALQRYQEFLDDFPESKFVTDVLNSINILRNKLGLKSYETGVLYMKMEEYEAAIISFNQVLDTYYDTDVIHRARQGMIKAYAGDRDIDKANEILKTYEASLLENALYDDALEFIQDVEKRIGKEK